MLETGIRRTGTAYRIFENVWLETERRKEGEEQLACDCLFDSDRSGDATVRSQPLFYALLVFPKRWA
jgi:hypothetical protein